MIVFLFTILASWLTADFITGVVLQPTRYRIKERRGE